MQPMLANSTTYADALPLIQSDDWHLEQKLDGHRLLIRFDNGKAVEVFGRNGQPYSKAVPNLSTGRDLTAWVDCELVDGTLWAFDLISVSSPSVRGADLAYHHRRLMLHFVDKNGLLPASMRVVPSVTDPAQKLLMLKALGSTAEGFMLKHRESRYLPGSRSTQMLKVKFVETVDCIVTELNRNGKDSISVAIVRDGALVPIGAVTMIGKPEVALGDVVEIRYLYVGANGRLYQPSFLRKRDDKSPLECTADQLRHVNKHVYESVPA